MVVALIYFMWKKQYIFNPNILLKLLYIPQKLQTFITKLKPPYWYQPSNSTNVETQETLMQHDTTWYKEIYTNKNLRETTRMDLIWIVLKKHRSEKHVSYIYSVWMCQIFGHGNPLIRVQTTRFRDNTPFIMYIINNR